MSDKPKLEAVLSGDEMAAFNEAAAAADRKAKNADRRNFLKNFALVSYLPIAASGWIKWAVSPRIETKAEYIPIREDGTIARAFRLEELPINAQRDLSGVNAAWFYVLMRESYSSGTMDYAWRVVSLMSDTRVREEYQKAHINTNENSPYAIYGKTGSVSIEKDSFQPLTPLEGYVGPPVGYEFRYWRIERKPNLQPTRRMYRTTMMFHRNVEMPNVRDRYEFNPPGLQVWEYPGAHPVSPV